MSMISIVVLNPVYWIEHDYLDIQAHVSLKCT